MSTPYCFCGQTLENEILIQCDGCMEWFHPRCCDVPDYVVPIVDKFYCQICVATRGPMVYKPVYNEHRQEFWDKDADNKPVQTGTPAFIKELLTRHFNSEGEIVLHMRGTQLTESYLEQQGFTTPIVIDTKDGLGMVLPPDSFTVIDVEAAIGSELYIDVIDVTRQAEIKMKLTEFVSYFNGTDRRRIFNVISLEFTNTAMSMFVEAPIIARRIDWANTMWDRSFEITAPQVQKYCLMSVKNSYTDFHIDFSGTSVWYHVLKGEKVFYFIKPTAANLTLYQQWMTSSNQSETFFADQVDFCYKCTLRPGQTMFIPTGWIHAVLTPVDSLVFGGNFLHSYNIPMQLQIYDMEKKIRAEPKFRLPYFETFNWFAAQKLYEEIFTLNRNECKVGSNLLLGLKALLGALKQWNAEKDYHLSRREQIPASINATKLLKDISKEIRHAERYINILNPPKPERESKRKRKRPINNDFIDYQLSPKDYHQATKSIQFEEPHKPLPIKLTLPKSSIDPYNQHAATERGKSKSLPGETQLSSILRPQQTTTIHRGGTILKLKLGTKDFCDTKPPDVTDAAVVSSLIASGNNSKSIYDFHDDSEKEDGLVTVAVKRKSKKKKESLKLKLQNTWSVKTVKSKKKKHSSDQGIHAKNGTESLLVSAAAPNQHTKMSPTTPDEIAGLLAMYAPGSKRNGRSKRNRNTATFSLLDDERTSDVHQDEDYIYPSLDNSDDDEVHIFKPRGRSKVDEAWNPKAKVGPLMPKMNRPAREGTKKQCVEKVLEAAAKKAEKIPTGNAPGEKSPKRQYRRKKSKSKNAARESVAATGDAAAAGSATSDAETTAATTESCRLSNSTTSAKKKTLAHHPAPTIRQRKGMKTVKQRLGKILKIHKMIH